MHAPSELGAFLRRRRELLSPSDVGLPGGGRRRTPGLRREEVAARAVMSVTYYERLEQGQGVHPSASVLHALAGALQLSAPDREHLFLLAGYAVPSAPAPTGYVDPVLQNVMSAAAATTVALLTDHLATVLVQNDLSTRLIGRFAGEPGYGGNLIWRWFTSPQWRAQRWLGVDDDDGGRVVAGYLRAALAQHAPDAEGAALAEDLAAVSELFARYWGDHDVTASYSSTATMYHENIGPLRLNCAVAFSPESTQRLVLFTPVPGSPAVERLAQLAAGPGRTA